MNKIVPLSLLGVATMIMPIKVNSAEYKEMTINAQSSVKIVAKVEENAQKNENTVQNSYTTRMTSYYSGESGSGECTGSGLCINDFQVNDKGWYTYQGKLVVATATPYLLKYGFTLYEGVHTYRYGDEITLNIDGVDYQAVVRDSCGNCMRTGRIDLFVSNANSVKDTQIIVKE
jgi:hypothetical protein